jgi:uncharacterized protein YukE
MADDVKVKFSGDFTDVPKGAQAAVGNAGSAMSSWFKELGTSMSASIISSLALSSIFGKFKDNISHALQYFRELDLTIRKVGGSGADFQKLAGIGKTLGVSMETVGRSVNFLNKYLGQAAAGSKSHQQTLSNYGFTLEEIQSGTISAIEVISRLGDEYDRTGNDTVVAAKAMEMFGRSGSLLIPIIKAGRDQIKEMTKDMKVYSEETIRAASETQKNIEKMERSWGKLGKSMVEAYSNYFISQQAKSMTGESINAAREGGGTAEQQATSAKELIVQGAEGSRTTILASLNYLKAIKDDFKSMGGQEMKYLTIAKLEKVLAEMDKIQPKKPVVQEQAAAGTVALAVSSLQAIGGGDISSIFSGTYQDTMLSQTTRIADATVKTAENTQTTPYQQPGQMPATK